MSTAEITEPSLLKRRQATLGFESAETEQVVEKLNLLLANYAVHYQKLRNFHWNVTGPDFFDLHEKFEIQYDLTKVAIDQLAERIRVFGDHPVSTMAGFLEMSDIQEVDNTFESSEMMTEILNDFEILLSHLVDVFDTAGEVGDIGTTKLVQGYIEDLEKKFWMFSAFNK